GIAALEESVAIWRELGDDGQLARGLSNLADQLVRQERTDEARELALEAEQVARKVTDDDDLLASTLESVARILVRLRDERAIEYAREATELRRSHPAQLGSSLENLASCLEELGRLEEAVRVTAEAVYVAREPR